MDFADQWVNIKSKDLEGYSFKFSLDGDNLSFYLSNLRQIFSTTVKKGSLASTCPGLEGTDESVLDVIYDKISDAEAKASFLPSNNNNGPFILQLISQMKTSIEKITFRLEDFNELGSDGMFYHLIAPLIHMQAESAAREKRLLELISTKDVAIAEYKITGATILPTINTDPFHTEQIQNINPAYKSLNDVLEQAGCLYSKAIKRPLVKLEVDSQNSRQDKPKRTRRRISDTVMKKHDEVISSVLESNSKALQKRKPKIRI